MASKFTMVDPGGQSEEEISTQAAVAGEVNERLGRAVEELGQKYESGAGGYNAASDAEPTGAAYQQAREEQARRRSEMKARERAVKEQSAQDDSELRAQLQASTAAEEDSDDEMLNALDDDPEIRRLRQQRMQQMKSEHNERAANLAKGHGQYREISQDEFLPEVTSSTQAVCHFYHKDFERCKIMDMHLAQLAPMHLECKFVKIDAEKAPFFVQKLQVQVLPSVLIFRDGVTTERILGFDGLCDGLPKGKEDEWPTSALARRLALARAITYKQGDVAQREGRNILGAAREGLTNSEFSDDD